MSDSLQIFNVVPGSAVGLVRTTDVSGQHFSCSVWRPVEPAAGDYILFDGPEQLEPNGPFFEAAFISAVDPDLDAVGTDELPLVGLFQLPSHQAEKDRFAAGLLHGLPPTVADLMNRQTALIAYDEALRKWPWLPHKHVITGRMWHLSSGWNTHAYLYRLPRPQPFLQAPSAAETITPALLKSKNEDGRSTCYKCGGNLNSWGTGKYCPVCEP